MLSTESDRRSQQTLKQDPPIKEKQSCLGCSKLVLNLGLHLKRSQQCQPLYDMEEMEDKKKNRVRLRKTSCERTRRKMQVNENAERFKENVRLQVKGHRDNKRIKNAEQFNYNNLFQRPL